MQPTQTRRRVLTALPLVGAIGLLRPASILAAQEQLETTSVRLGKTAGLCVAPIYVLEQLLRAEGFTDIQYVQLPPNQSAPDGIARSDIDFGANFAPVLVSALDRGLPVTALGPLHLGCFEVFGGESVRKVADLRGKRVAINTFGSPWHLFLSVIAANIGIDPGKDINWLTVGDNAMQLFAEGKADAFLGFPPEPQQLRARNSGQVILDSTKDPPWSQYVCCLLIGGRDYVHRYPVATKRVLRATLKATDLCATEPAQAAQQMVDGGFTTQYDYALQTLRELPYGRWRDFDPEDSVRFYALRLREVGMSKLSPQKIIGTGTDWRFLNELKRELKV